MGNGEKAMVSKRIKVRRRTMRIRTNWKKTQFGRTLMNGKKVP